MPTIKITKEQIKAASSEIKDTSTVPQGKTEITIPSLQETKLTNAMNNDFAMKSRVYEEVLAPELVENEKLKREQKKTLMNNIFKILKWQFIMTYIFVIIGLISVILSELINIKESLALASISFVKFYITSIIVELIAILFFIVKNVFDTSITDLFSNFDKNNKEKE